MTDEPEQVVTVVGTRDSGGNLNVTAYEGYYSPRTVSEDGSPIEQTHPPIIVYAKVSNPLNKARATEAAQKLTRAIHQARVALEGKSRSTTFVVLGRVYTVGEVLDDLLNTEFTATDREDFGNNGVGQSQRGLFGEPNTDIINMNHILDGYGHPNYANNEGMMALLFHELGHISAIGYTFWDYSYSLWLQEPASQREVWIDGDYTTNVEKFANDFLMAVTGVLIVAYAGMPYPGPGAVEPNDIYNQHMAEFGN